MAEVNFEVVRRDDAALIDAIDLFAHRVGVLPDSVKVTVYLAKDHPPAEFQLSDAANNGMVALSREIRSSMWTQITGGFQFGGNASIRVMRPPQASHDQVHLNFPDQGKRQENVIRIVSAAQEAFGPSYQQGPLDQALGPALGEFYSRREAALLRLEGLTQKLIEDNQEYRRRADAEIEEERKALLAQVQQEREKNERAISGATAALAEREKALAAEKAALDLRTSQQVRRDNVKGLKSTLKSRAESFKLTADTQNKRFPIHAIFVALLVVSATVAAFGLFVGPSDKETGPLLWLHFLRVPAGVIGFAFAAVFYIRWNDQWFREHADEEFRARQLELDIDRASWITELALELRDEKTELPDVLLERLSSGLFATKASAAVKHPTEDVLAALFGESSRVKMKSPLVEAELSRRGFRRAQDRLGEE